MTVSTCHTSVLRQNPDLISYPIYKVVIVDVPLTHYPDIFLNHDPSQTYFGMSLYAETPGVGTVTLV